VSLSVVGRAKSDHPSGIVVVFFRPWWVEMVVLKVWVPAALYRAAESDLMTKLAANVNRRSSRETIGIVAHCKNLSTLLQHRELANATPRMSRSAAPSRRTGTLWIKDPRRHEGGLSGGFYGIRAVARSDPGDGFI
jgi:hypothetical protein